MTLYLVPDIDAAVAKLRHILCDDTEPQHDLLWSVVSLTRDDCPPHGIERPIAVDSVDDRSSRQLSIYDQDEGAPPPRYATKADIYNWLHGPGDTEQVVACCDDCNHISHSRCLACGMDDAECLQIVYPKTPA